MSIKEFTKSGTFVLVVLVLVVVLLPFGIEQIGEATDLFSFPTTKWVKGLFTSQSAGGGSSKDVTKVNWEQQAKDLEAFSEWADGLAEAKISIVRPEVFQIVRADPNPATATHFSWKLQLLSDKLELNATQVRSKLELICEPEDGVSGKVATVKPLSGGEKGFLVTVDGVRGTGKIGLSYAGLPPVYYYVKTPGSLVATKVGLKNMVGVVATKAALFTYYKKLYEDIGLYEENKMQIYKYLVAVGADC